MEARVAVLEEIASATRETLSDIRSELRGIRGELTDVRTDVAKLRTEMHAGLADLRTEMHAGLGGLRTDVSYLKGRIEQLPSTWMMITGILTGQVVLGALFVAAFRFAGKG